VLHDIKQARGQIPYSERGQIAPDISSYKNVNLCGNFSNKLKLCSGLLLAALSVIMVVTFDCYVG